MKIVILFAFCVLFAAIAECGTPLPSAVQQHLDMKRSETVAQEHSHEAVHQKARDVMKAKPTYVERQDNGTIPGWYCPVSLYDANDGCDCGCGIQDPDCDKGDSQASLLYGCYGSGNYTCVGGYCTVPVPSGWTCSPYFYNNNDGCDCDCGIQDPDCDNGPLGQPIYNCESFALPKCVRGTCTERPKPPVRIAYDGFYTITGACGKILSTGDPSDSGTDYDYDGEDGYYGEYEGEYGGEYGGEARSLSERVSISTGIGVVLQDDNFLPVTDVESSFTAIASVVSLDPTQKVTLAGRTEVPIFKGKALFDNIIALGPADAEFYLVVNTNPPLIPAQSPFTVKLKAGDPVNIRYKLANSTVNVNGSFSVPTDAILNGRVDVIDDCGNRIKTNSPGLQCLAFDHFTFILNDQICNSSIPYQTPGTVPLSMPTTPGIYDVYFLNATVNPNIYSAQIVIGSVTFEVEPKSEYQCFKLIDSTAGLTSEDVVAFDKQMIPDATYLQIAQTLFSIDAERPSIMKFNFTASKHTTAFHSKLNSTFAQWNLAAKHFFVEQDPNFLKVVSLSLVGVGGETIEAEFKLPFCGSVKPDMQRRLIASWLFSLSDAYATFVQSAGSTGVNDTIQVQSTQDVICYGDYGSYQCCSRLSLLNAGGACPAPETSTLSIALIAISIIFAFLAACYAVALVFVFFQQSGAIYTVMEDITSLSEVDLRKKRRISLLIVIAAPIVMACGMAQSILVINPDRSNIVGLRALVGIVEGLFIAFWYIAAIHHFFTVFVRGRAPSRRADLFYFVALLSVIWFSLFNVLWTFSWVTLGLLLNPGRVVAYFVAFLTVFAVAVFKVQSLVTLMKQVEMALHKELFKRVMKGKLGVDFKDEEFDPLESANLETPKLIAFLREKGLDEKEAEKVAKQIEKFRRFRVRFIIGNLIGTLFLLTALLVFILLGVEAFRTKSGAVSSVGSALEAIAGGSSMVNEKLGDKATEIRELVQTFAARRGAGRNSTTSGQIALSPATPDNA